MRFFQKRRICAPFGKKRFCPTYFEYAFFGPTYLYRTNHGLNKLKKTWFTNRIVFPDGAPTYTGVYLEKDFQVSGVAINLS